MAATRRQSTKAPEAAWSAEQTFLHQCAHARVVELSARALRFHLAEIEKIEMVGERQRLLDVLLDEQDGGAGRPARAVAAMS